MADRLRLYNRCLLELGERRLGSLRDHTEPRRLLDALWDDAVAYCLEQGQWNFAAKAVQAEAEAGIAPSFGFQHAFRQPDDYVRLMGISDNDRFNPPLTAYSDEGGYWFADREALFVRYVSNAPDYGLNLSLWPESFTKFVQLYLALQLAPALGISAGKIELLELKTKRARVDARSKDAMNEAPQFRPQGSWSAARAGRSGRRYDRA